MKFRIRSKLQKLHKKLSVAYWKFISKITRKVASYAHSNLFHAEWDYNPPENFDHYIDLYWKWKTDCTPNWLERGVFNVLAMQCFKEPVVVECCCGEGFYDKYFYSGIAKAIYASDIDKQAIKEAHKKNSAKNILFEVADIREEIVPNNFTSVQGGVTNIIWEAAIAYFTEKEIDELLTKMASTLKPQKGILSGQTNYAINDKKPFSQHKREFRRREDLRDFLRKYFKNVIVFETEYTYRHNFYFYASDGVIPFSEKWQNWIKS